MRFLFKQIVLTRDGKEYKGQERYFFGFRFTGNVAGMHPKEGEVRKCEWTSIASLEYRLLFDG